MGVCTKMKFSFLVLLLTFSLTNADPPQQKDVESCLIVWKPKGRSLSKCDWVKQDTEDRCSMLLTQKLVGPENLPEGKKKINARNICEKTCTGWNEPEEEEV